MIKHYRFQSVGSTMDKAKELITDGTELPFSVTAEQQTAGRGRGGKVWISANVGLYSTFCYLIPAPIAKLTGFSVSLGARLCQTLEPFTDSLLIKWPNDLFMFDRVKCRWLKIGGILIEVSEPIISIGVGLNLHGVSAETSEAGAICDIIKREITFDQVFSAVADGIDHCYRAFQDNFSSIPFLAEAERRLIFLGKEVEVSHGARTLRGICSGLSERGGLLLGESEVTSGSVNSWEARE